MLKNEELVAIIHLPRDQFTEKFKDWQLKYFAQNPDLTGASLSNADLQGKQLQSFIFEGADLHHADLSGADLSLANLKGANLSHCKLENCDLSGCVLEEANLSFAVLKNVKWKGAELKEANLQGAFIAQDASALKEADKLNPQQLEQACNWPLAKYDESLLANPNLPFYKRGIGLEHNERLQSHKQDLGGYDLTNVNLRGANLTNFTLARTNLCGADLRGVKGLEGEQLEQARNWPLAKYDESQLTNPNLPFHKRGIGPEHNERLHSDKRDFSEYDLSHVDLRGANLANFNLKEANLQGATFKKATGLTKRQIEQAVNWPLAYYDPDQLKEFGLAKDHNARLREKTLRKYGLSGTTLKGADLHGFNLYKAVLRGAQLEGANLQKAVIMGADLQGANLQGANLAGAVLIEANLQDANLQGANLEHADLTRAHLQHANLSEPDLQRDATANSNGDPMPRSMNGAHVEGAILKEAFLANANLEGATGLVPEQLAGTSLTGASLPSALKEKFQNLDYIEQTSKYARSLFFILLLACLYALITIAATTDAQLVSSSASLLLPLFHVKVPVVSFYFLAPLLLMGVYLALNLSLQRLWEQLAKLPAIFPDGTSLDEKAHPWLLIGLVRSRVFHLTLQENRPLLVVPQNLFYSLLAWGVVPLTLTVIWWRYLSRHDWYWTVAQLCLIAIASAMAVFFGKVSRSTLRGKRRQPKKDKYIIRQALIGSACGLVMFASCLFLSYGAIEGARPGYDTEMDILQTASTLSWLPWTYAQVHLDPFAELKDEALSTKSENWTEKSPLDHIKGASLQGRDLRYGNLRNAFLVKADLSNANLSKADLSGADLRFANLGGATLEGANLSGANLTGADLKDVKGLTQAQLLTTKKDREGTPAPEQLAAQPETPSPVEEGEPVASTKPAEEDASAPEQLAAQPETPSPVEEGEPVASTKPAEEDASAPEQLAAQPETPSPVEEGEPVASTKPAEEATPGPEQLAAQPETPSPVEEGEPVASTKPAEEDASAPEQLAAQPETPSPVEEGEPVASTKPAEEATPAPEQLAAQPEAQPKTRSPVEEGEPVASTKPAKEATSSPEQLAAQPETPSPVEEGEPVASTKSAEEATPGPEQLTAQPEAQPKTRSPVEEREPDAPAKSAEEATPAPEQLAAKPDPATTGKQNMLVSKNQSPPSGTSNAIEGGDSPVSTPTGSNNIQSVSQLDPNQPVRLGVFTKPADQDKVVSALRPLGYDMWEIESSVPEGQTNMIWFGAQVQEKDVRRVALALVCAEVTIKGIGPFPKNNKSDRIEVGFNKYLEDSPQLTFTEVINMEFPTIPASPTEDFSWLKDCP